MSELAQVLRPLLPVDDPNALVDASTGDDAAVYRLSDERALVVTLDFFSPVVDDPFDFGRIAAVNALSDVYAMGASPLFALNLLAFPRKLLPEGLAERIIEGGATVAREAGIPILGGHSIDDPEPKYGMVVVGDVSPDALVTNAAVKPGEALVLTKPLGTGVLATALKADAASDDQVAGAVASMARLNRRAAESMLAVGAAAATDVTGFGLLGHLRAMLRASGLAAEVSLSAVPFLPGAADAARAGHIPGGSRRNLSDVEADVTFAPQLDEVSRLLLADAQTSGGLLVSLPPERVDDFMTGLGDEAAHAAVIGHARPGTPGAIGVLP